MNINTAHSIPEELMALPRWNKWFSVPNREDPSKKPSKVPFQVNGYRASPTDSAVDQWTTFKAAYQSYQETGARGIGFLFIKADPYTGIDLDNVRDRETGEVSERGMSIISKFPGAHKEISPSGTGIKLIVRGKKPKWCSRCKKKFDDGEQVEVYDHSHYFAVTGEVFGAPVWKIGEHEPEIAGLCDDLFSKEPDDYTPSQVDVEELGLDDRELLDILVSFHGEKFEHLFSGDISLYNDDHSAADAALCTHLAFVARDPETISRIFRASGLYRQKWERETYRKPTINRALKRQTEFYDPTGFLKRRIEKMYLGMLQVRWEDYKDGLIVLALLEMAHESCEYRGDAIIVDAALRDLRISTNISIGTISRRTNFLDQSPYPLQILRRGHHDQRSRFLISHPDKNSIFIPESNDENTIDTPSTADKQHVSNIMFKVRTLLAYSPLNVASQWAILRVIPFRKIAQNEVYAIIRYKGSKKNFRRYVVNPLNGAKLIKVDKKGFINLRDDIEARAQRIFDDDRYQWVIADVKKQREDKQREDYERSMLRDPLAELLRSRRSGGLADVAD